MAIDIASDRVFGSDLPFVCWIFLFVIVMTNSKSQKSTARAINISDEDWRSLPRKRKTG